MNKSACSFAIAQWKAKFPKQINTFIDEKIAKRRVKMNAFYGR